MVKLPISTIFVFLIYFTGISQVNFSEQYDTLYYKSGMVKPCLIQKIEYPLIHFTAINSKGITVSASISINKLKYYVEYDEMGRTRLTPINDADGKEFKLEPRTDSIWVYPHHLSVNPFSPFFLGLNFSYMYRFGLNKEFAIHLPFRVFTFFGNGIFFQTGLGFNYFAASNQNHSVYLGFSPQYYFLEGYRMIGFPIYIGYIKNLTESITFHGYIGAGPKIGKDFNFPLILDAHFGIGFNLGQKQLTYLQAKKQ